MTLKMSRDFKKRASLAAEKAGYVSLTSYLYEQLRKLVRESSN